jgi:uncharacterized protein YbjT (DUF2867 family)
MDALPVDALPVASHIVVTVGTGTLGRLVVVRLRDAGYHARVPGRRGSFPPRRDAPTMNSSAT